MKKWKFFLGQKSKFETSKYWEARYKLNGKSGSGSYGNLALFKANFLNQFLLKNNINDVIELGCGDGNQLKFVKYKKYIGYDISPSAIKLCESIFKQDDSKKFYLLGKFQKIDLQTELSLSLDVIFHLIEDDLYEVYMNNLFSISNRYVIIYSSNYEKKLSEHVRCRKFTNWVEKNQKNKFELVEIIKNKYPFNQNYPDTTSFSDFYIY